MKKIITALLALCMLASMCALASAESTADSQFPWGISCDEYISGRQLTDYEKAEPNNNVTLLHMTYTDTDAEDLVFYNDQFVGTMYDYTGSDQAQIDMLAQLLGTLVGETTEGGGERIFEIMNILIPGMYASSADFSNCIVASGADGIFGAMCRYRESGYALLIVNETMLKELSAAKTSPMGAGPIGSGITVGGSAGTTAGENAETQAEPASHAVSVGGGLTIDGSLDKAADENAATQTEPAATVPPVSVGGGLTIGGNLSTAVTKAETAEELVIAASAEFPWGMGVSEYVAHMGLAEYETLDLGNGITGLAQTGTNGEYELYIFKNNQFAANLLELYSEEATDPANLVSYFEALFGTYAEAEPDDVAEVMNLMLPLGMTADELTCTYTANLGGGVYAYCFLYEGCADIAVVNELLVR